ncbi:Uncharacterized protein QTN25_004433 [Entamoeba marina]
MSQHHQCLLKHFPSLKLSCKPKDKSYVSNSPIVHSPKCLDPPKSLDPTDTKKQTLTKRESTNRENISKAALIGLCSAYGYDVRVKLPVRQTTSQVTYENLLISSTTIFNANFPTTSNNVNEAKKTSSRNDKKSASARIFNEVSKFIIETNCLRFSETKSRSTQKTEKLIKYKWIDPFNEIGFRMFAEGIISIVHQLPLEKSTTGKYVILKGYDSKVVELYSSIISNSTLLINSELFNNSQDYCNNDLISNGTTNLDFVEAKPIYDCSSSNLCLQDCSATYSVSNTDTQVWNLQSTLPSDQTNQAPYVQEGINSEQPYTYYVWGENLEFYKNEEELY